MELTIRFSWDFGWSDHDNHPTKPLNPKNDPPSGGSFICEKKNLDLAIYKSLRVW